MENTPFNTASKPSIGIDIENINLLPPSANYSEDDFYKSNFALSEITYCALQPSPLASFAGLFAAKEAIVKADNSYLNTAFNQIIIDHLPDGKPVHPNFQISITHTSELAAAVAICQPQPTCFPFQKTPANFNSSLAYLVTFIALFFSFLALLLVLFFR